MVQRIFYTYYYVHVGEEKQYPAPGIYTTLEFACDAADAEMREWASASGYGVTFVKPLRGEAIETQLDEKSLAIYGSILRNKDDGVVYTIEVVYVMK